jgi:hypothetical protein
MTKSNNEDARAELKRFYEQTSKHSSYQSVPEFVGAALDYEEPIARNWRDDKNRLRYIESRAQPGSGESWTDFGANTGFFTLSLAHKHPATRFLAIEANRVHATFIRRVTELFSLRNVEILDRPIGLEDLPSLPKSDVMLHLNVLHHAGKDFDSAHVKDVEQFAPYARRYLAGLRSACSRLVFQMGSNLWGDKLKPIISREDDVGKLKLYCELIADAGWTVRSVAYPGADAEAIEYDDLDPSLVTRLGDAQWDNIGALVTNALARFSLERHIGEFYRRPLFILE